MDITVSVEHREGHCVGGDLDFASGSLTSWQVCLADGVCQVETGTLPAGTDAVRDLLKRLLCPDGRRIVVKVPSKHILTI